MDKTPPTHTHSGLESGCGVPPGILLTLPYWSREQGALGIGFLTKG